MYDVQLELLKQSLSNINSLALTTDFWTDRKNNSFMCLTGHWIDSNMNFQSSIIHFQLFCDRHVASNIAAEVKGRLHHLNIEDKISSITTDGGSNIRSAVQNIWKINRIWCVAHRLHLVICNGLCFWKKFKNNQIDHDTGKDDLNRDSLIQSSTKSRSNLPSMDIVDQFHGKSFRFISSHNIRV